MAKFRNSRDYWSYAYDVNDKGVNISSYVLYMLNRTQAMFKYENLPKTIPSRDLELILQKSGHATIADVDGELYAFLGSLGGEPNAYYMPTFSVVANPYLKLSKQYEIDKDCIVIPNDPLYIGLLPLLFRYATLLSENDISLRLATVNSRIVSVIDAESDSDKKSAEAYLSDIERGKLGVIGGKTFVDRVHVQNYGASNITALIELEQYLKASMYHEIGLDANYNMKRESLNSAESALNSDSIRPLIDSMLTTRQEGVEKVNIMFGTNISVGLDSAWKESEVMEDEAENGSSDGGWPVDMGDDSGNSDGNSTMAD